MSTTLRSARLKITQNFDQVQVQLFALTPLYEQLQLCSVEAGFPNEDLFTFACRTAFFGVISLETAPSSSFSDSQDSPFTVSSSSPLYDDQWDDKVTVSDSSVRSCALVLNKPPRKSPVIWSDLYTSFPLNLLHIHLIREENSRWVLSSKKNIARKAMPKRLSGLFSTILSGT